MKNIQSVINSIVLLFSTCLLSFNHFGQTITIGTGTSTSDKSPSYGFYDYSWSNTLYTQAEINTNGSILSIGYYVETNSGTMLNQKIYLAHTTVTSLTSAQPNSASMTLVYDGDITWTSGGWNTISLSTPFAYNNTDNLQVYFENHDGSWISARQYFRYSTVSNSAYYRGQDGSFPTTTGTYTTSRPNIQLTFGSLVCDDPSSLSASSLTTSSANLSWIENGASTNWDIEYGLSGFSATGTPNINDLNNNPYALSGLLPSTSYDYYVRSDCGYSQSNWVGPYTFTTLGCNVQDPSGFTGTNVTSSSITLDWTENGNATNWEFAVGTGGFTPTTATGSSTSNPYTYGGLSLTTNYDIYVRSTCGGVASDWVGPINFTTLSIPTNYTSELLDGWAKGCAQLADGNYIYTGYANSEVQIVKTQQGGEVIWAKTFGGTSTDYGYALVNADDGGFVNFAKTRSTGLNPHGSDDLLVTKFDTDGVPIWSRAIGTTNSEAADNGTIIRNSDNTFSFVASANYNADLVFGHLASDGTTLALKEFSLRTGAQGYGITQTSDGGWVICGTYTFSNYEFFAIKISSSYTLQWSMVWGDGTGNQDKIYTIIENSPNDYTVFGSTYGLGSTPQNMYAARFTNSGSGPTVIWQKAYGDAYGCYFTHAIVASDGNYVATGTSGAYDYVTEYQDSYLVKINPVNGNIIWQTFKNDDGVSNRIGECVYEDNTGSFIVAGLGGYDMLKFDANGGICDGGIGFLVAEDLGTTFTNLINNTEGVSKDWFGAANSSVAITPVDNGTFGPGCNVAPIVLGIESFEINSIRCESGRITLDWHSNLMSIDRYEIEGSIDGMNYESFGVQQLVNSSGYYSSIIASTSIRKYYRVVAHDQNGTVHYSKLAINPCEMNSPFIMYPNPASDEVVFVVQGENDIDAIEIIDINGKIVYRNAQVANNHRVDLTQWQGGVYLVKLSSRSNTYQTKLVVI